MRTRRFAKEPAVSEGEEDWPSINTIPGGWIPLNRNQSLKSLNRHHNPRLQLMILL